MLLQGRQSVMGVLLQLCLSCLVVKQLLSQLHMFHRGAEQLPGERADVPTVDSLIRNASCTVPDTGQWAKGTARPGAHYDVRSASAIVCFNAALSNELCEPVRPLAMSGVAESRPVSADPGQNLLQAS